MCEYCDDEDYEGGDSVVDPEAQARLMASREAIYEAMSRSLEASQVEVSTLRVQRDEAQGEAALWKTRAEAMAHRARGMAAQLWWGEEGWD